MKVLAFSGGVFVKSVYSARWNTARVVHEPWPDNAVAFLGFSVLTAASGASFATAQFELADGKVHRYFYTLLGLDGTPASAILEVESYEVAGIGPGLVGEGFNVLLRPTIFDKCFEADVTDWLLLH